MSDYNSPTADEARVLVEEYSSRSYGTLAKKYGVSRATMRSRILRAHATLGKPIPSKRPDTTWMHEAVRLIQDHWKAKDIARRLGVHPDQVWALARRRSLPFTWPRKTT